MAKLQFDHFTVMVIPPATSYGPVDGRKYTLTSMGSTLPRMLRIGNKYHINMDNYQYEDILTAEWMPKLGEYVLSGRVFVSGGELDEDAAQKRLNLLQAELPGMLGAIIKGDHALYKHVPWLLDAPIYIQFDSHYPHLHIIQNFGTPRSYLTHTE